MACDFSSAIIDPIQGLVDYVSDIKPYHSKIVEVIVEYQHNELIDVTVLDDLELRILMEFPDPATEIVLGSCSVLQKQIWGAMDDQTVFQLDDPIPYLTVYDEFNASPGQTVFSLSQLVNGALLSNIASVKINGTPTTSYTLNVAGSKVTIASPAIQMGDYVVIEYLSAKPDTSRFTVTVNGVAAEISMTTNDEFTILGPVPLVRNDWVTATLCGPSYPSFECFPGFDTTAYDDPDNFVLATVDDVTNTIIVPYDRTHVYTAGTEIAVKTSLISSLGSPVESPLMGSPAATVDSYRVYTVLSSTYTPGTTTTDPITTIVIDDSIRGIDPPNYTLPAGFEYIYFVGLNPLPLIDALGYSNADDHPVETPNEGRLELDIISINETTNIIEVDGDLSTSTLKAGDTFSVVNSTNHSGTYAIASITYNGSPATTKIVVTEDILAAEAVGDSATAVFDIMSNAFIVNGNVATRYRQGHIFDVKNGPNRGTYVTLTADSVIVEKGRETFNSITGGQVDFTLATTTISGISQHATDLGVPDSSLLSVELKRSNQLITLGVLVTSPTTFTVVSGPLPLVATDEVIAVTSDRRTRIRVTDTIVPGGINGSIQDHPLGYDDEIIFCDNTPYTLVRVYIQEQLAFSGLSLSLSDDLIVYNIENTDSIPYDSFPEGTIFNPELPLSPNVFDYWYPGIPILHVDVGLNKIVIVGDWTSYFGISGGTYFNIESTSVATESHLSASTALDYSTTYFPGIYPEMVVTVVTLNSGYNTISLSALNGMVTDPTVGATYPLALYQWDTVSWKSVYAGYSDVKAAIGSLGVVGREVIGAYEGQTVFTISTGSPVAFTLPVGSSYGSPVLDSAYMSVTVNKVPVEFAVIDSTTFEIFPAGSPAYTILDTDVIEVTVRDHINTEKNAYVSQFSTEAHSKIHEVVSGNSVDSTITLTGGNYLRRLTPDLIMTCSGGSGSPYVTSVLTGQWHPLYYNVIDVDAVAGTITIPGDASKIFSGAGDILMMHSYNNEEEFIVQSVVVGGSPLVTTVTVSSPNVIETTYNNPELASPQSEILQNFSKDLGWITAGTFNPTTQETLFAVASVSTGSPSLSLDNIDTVTYHLHGPLRFDIKMHRTLAMATSMNDAMGIAEQALGIPQLFEIIDIDLVNNTFTISGDYSNLFPTNTTFTIQDSYNQLNNQSSTSGSPDYAPQPWTVVGIGSPVSIGAITVGSPATTVIKVAEPINTEGSPPVANMPYGTIVLVQYSVGSTPVNQAATTFEDTLYFGWGTTLRWDIIATNVAANTIYLQGDLTGVIYVNDNGSIVGSYGNDADYDVVGVSYDIGSNRTAVVLNGPLTIVGSPPSEIIGSPAGIPGSPGDALDGMFQLEGIDITSWFQYNIVNANVTDDTFVVQGNATSDIQTGQEFRIIGTPGNDGLYLSDTINPPVFDGVNTTITVDATSNFHVSTSQGLAVGSPLTDFGSPYRVGGGVLQAARDYGIHIFHRDTIGTTVTETLLGPVPTDGGNIAGAFDYPAFDMGTFDENAEVLKYYTNPTEKP